MTCEAHDKAADLMRYREIPTSRKQTFRRLDQVICTWTASEDQRITVAGVAIDTAVCRICRARICRYQAGSSRFVIKMIEESLE